MKVICSLFLILLLFVSCKRTNESIFGTIPSIYENKMVILTKDLKSRGIKGGALVNELVNKTDSVFSMAEKEATPQIKSMQGKTINYKVDSDAEVAIKSDIKIVKVLLPNMSSSEMGTKVLLYSKVESKDDELYYIIESDKDTIDCGVFSLPKESNIVQFQLTSPNVPATYQESCKLLHFINKNKYSQLKADIEQKQNQWRKDYKEKLGI